jgi:hypothetical protein
MGWKPLVSANPAQSATYQPYLRVRYTQFSTSIVWTALTLNILDMNMFMTNFIIWPVSDAFLWAITQLETKITKHLFAHYFKNINTTPVWSPPTAGHIWSHFHNIFLCYWLLLFMSLEWDYLSELQPPMGLFSIPSMICEYWEPQRNDTDTGKPKNSENNLSQCHTVHHKSHMDWLRLELGPPGWEACE